MNINEMTQKQFRYLPERASFKEDIGEFDSLVILPTKYKHDSGYRCMDFVAVRKQEPICLLAGGSDVLHIDGISGLGRDVYFKPNIKIDPKSWSVDCLPKSGLLRLFAGNRKLAVGCALSSFEVYALDYKPPQP
jgi:hypothetical protein